jgi:hypothetical protein
MKATKQSSIPLEASMKRVIAAIALILGAASYARVEQKHSGHIVLPNSKLLACRASACSQLWLDDSPNPIYPRQVLVDIFGEGPCPLGLQAIYEKSVSLDDLKASIDEQYGKWALPSNSSSPVKLWRVESEKFAIQLSVTSDRTKELTRKDKNAFGLRPVV